MTTTSHLPEVSITPGEATGPTADAFAERLFASTLGTFDVLAVYLGDRLGWYRSLATGGSATPAELANRTFTDERYAQEWLEQQAVVGILTVTGEGENRRFTLPPGPAEVLTDADSLTYLAPLARMVLAPAAQLPALLEAYRSGGGVSWDELGADARESQADMNKPWFEQRLASALAAVPDVHEVLDRPGTRILDVGCGGGWSSIALAHAYPYAIVHGVDLDLPSVELARTNAEAAGVADRVRFEHSDGSALGAHEGSYDVAFAFECVHDMAQPVEVLRSVRQAVGPDGLVIVMDEAVADEFTAPGDEIEQLMYGYSLFICLPDGRSASPSEATGTVMRHSTLASYARRAGFAGADVLPTGDFGLFRFYRLH